MDHRNPEYRFTCQKNGRYCDISGRPVEKPIVYLTPEKWYRNNISGRLPQGIKPGELSDYPGPFFAVNATQDSSGNWTFSTGNKIDR